MNIHQVSVSYVQEQDRLLLRLNTRTGEEMRLWLTRRLVLPLLSALQKSEADLSTRADLQNAAIVAPDPASRQLLGDFKRVDALQRADFSTPYQAQDTAPLAEPLLVTEVAVAARSSGPLRLVFKEALPGQSGGRQCQVELELGLLHALLHLLQQGIGISGWVNKDAAPAALAPAQEAAPKYLN